MRGSGGNSSFPVELFVGALGVRARPQKRPGRLPPSLSLTRPGDSRDYAISALVRFNFGDRFGDFLADAPAPRHAAPRALHRATRITRFAVEIDRYRKNVDYQVKVAKSSANGISMCRVLRGRDVISRDTLVSRMLPRAVPYSVTCPGSALSASPSRGSIPFGKIKRKVVESRDCSYSKFPIFFPSADQLNCRSLNISGGKTEG